MTKRILTFLILLTTICVNSQSYVGFLTDNYSGVHGVISNPANIVDSRFKTDINLVGISGFAANDAYGVNIFDTAKSDYDFDRDATKNFTDNNNVGLNLDILGPSFMFNINDKNSIAIFTRARFFANLKEVNGNTIDVLDDFEDNILVDEGELFGAANLWGEIGVSYAKVLYNKDQHFVKGGLSLKYLQGAASAYVNSKDLFIEIKDNTINPLLDKDVEASGEVSYGNSEGEEDFDDLEFDFEDFTGTGFGIDLGFVYEWRPDHKGDVYTLKNINKYKLKLGLSVTDIGNINYKDGVDQEYTLNLNSNDIDDLDDLTDFSTSFYTLNNPTGNNGYKFKLPTALHFNADYSFNDKFYLNLNTDFSLVSKTAEAASSISNIVSLTPRFETKWISAYIPLSVAQYSGFRAGFGLRAGPLYLGSGSIVTNLFGDDSKGADVYAGLKIPIYQGGAKDKDGDGVVDKLDNCPKIPGPQENNGCPWGDEDEDGVLDNVDNCPKIKGLKENNGCPVVDKDKDGINDNVDKCPEVFGPQENNGCPWGDEDKDGVLDNVDKCPKVLGAQENNGCPWGDKDKDGVLDNVDKCPNNVGVAELQGCPKPKILAPIEAEKLKELQSFAKAIYFNSGRSTFRPGVTDKLELIANIMREYPNANFNIEGHTDSQGAATTNLSLSDKRARAVLTYLSSRGVSESRLSSIGYGEDYPIADNQTRDGRAQNRRVEIKLRK